MESRRPDTRVAVPANTVTTTAAVTAGMTAAVANWADESKECIESSEARAFRCADTLIEE
jgi:hypothetical protein